MTFHPYNIRVKGFLIFLTIFTSSLSFAEVLKFDVSGYKRELYSYKLVCEKMGLKHLLMIDVIDPSNLDCMGKKVSIKKFCLQEVGESKFLRGYINTKLSEVVCEKGNKAFLSIGCDKRDKRYCKAPMDGCMKLGKFFAHSHKLSHHSFVEKDVDNVLNCYFDFPELKKPVEKWSFKEPEVIDKDIFAFDKVQKEYPIRESTNYSFGLGK